MEKNNGTIFFVIALVIILILLILYIQSIKWKTNVGYNVSPFPKKFEGKFPKYMFNGSSYAPDKYGFGVPVYSLEQSPEFYKKHRKATLTYLTAVYPMGKKSFESLGDLELASFYNSLTYYFNCGFNYKGDELLDGGPNVKYPFPTKWDPLPCSKDYPLPYAPQGWFFNWTAYQKYNIPQTYSDSGPDVNPDEFGSCRPGVAFGVYNRELRSGPGPLWINCRAMVRNATRPYGIVNTGRAPFDASWPPTSVWNYMDARYMPWNYPRDFVNGAKDNQFVEITHNQYTPGMVQSLGFWWNTFIGTGVFYNVGKTLSGRTKIGVMLKLLTELKEKRPEIYNNFYANMTPHQAVFSQAACTYDNVNKKWVPPQNCQKDYVVCNFWCIPDNLGAGANMPWFEVANNFYYETIRLQNENGIPDATPTPKGIELAVEASANQTDYQLDRMSISVLCDEPNFWAGYILGYDSLQMPVDPNGNGYYAWETEDLRIPDTGKFAGIRKDIEKREYKRFITIDNSDPEPHARFGNMYDADFVSMWVHKLKDNKFISVRDPLDIYNKDKVQVCQDVEKEEGVCHNIPAAPGRPPLKPGVLGPWYAIFCGNAPMSNEYKCLQLGKEPDPDYPACKTTGGDITC